MVNQTRKNKGITRQSGSRKKVQRKGVRDQRKENKVEYNKRECI